MEAISLRFKLKLILDIIMLILLLMAMSYLLIGAKAHEFIGISFICIIIVHNLFNIKWYKHIFRGKYNLTRIFHTAVNLLLVIFLLERLFSGLLFAGFLPQIFNSALFMAIARKTHLLGAYWGFMLISMHIGCHWQMLSNKLKNIFKLTPKIWNVFCFVATIIAIYGVYALIKQDIFQYLFLQNEFFLFNDKQSLINYIFDFTAIMELIIYVTNYVYKFTQKYK